MNSLLEFYKNKTVLILGHTGFKGSWLTKILSLAGANVIGYSLDAPTNPNLFSILSLQNQIVSIIGDIRDLQKLNLVFDKYQPEIVFNLAAQPLVRESYKNPVYTYDVNIMGIVNICESIRLHNCVKSFVNITTDKVYENHDWKNHYFTEDEKLDGYDPYSNSKSCSELVTHAYYKSFLKEKNIAVSTARAGNILGGGDFSADRLIPDTIRALEHNNELTIRNPNSSRPYQHVLDALACYLLIAKLQYLDKNLSGAYNVGPDQDEIITNIKLINLFKQYINNLKYISLDDNTGPHEAIYLALNTDKAKLLLNWHPKLSIKQAVKLTAEWYQAWLDGDNLILLTEKQIKEFFND